MSSLDVVVTDRTLDGPHGPLPVRLYDGPQPATGLVWVHGGGFVGGDLDMPEADWVARTLAAAGVYVVSVEYRLSPVPEMFADWQPQRAGVHFPVASEEVTAAFTWTCTAGLGPESWSLGGASAGANLAAGAALRLRDGAGVTPRTVVLAYPLVHARLPAPRPELATKIAALPPQARFAPETVVLLNENYLGHDLSKLPPYAFPAQADLQGLPPTFVLNSDHDSLRSSGEAYAAALAAAGVDVLQVREDGTRHGHLNEPDDPAAARSLARIAAWLTASGPGGTAHERA